MHQNTRLLCFQDTFLKKNKLKSATTAHIFTKDAAGEPIRNIPLEVQTWPVLSRQDWCVWQCDTTLPTLLRPALGALCKHKLQSLSGGNGISLFSLFASPGTRSSLRHPPQPHPTAIQLIQNTTTPRWFVRASPVSKQQEKAKILACPWQLTGYQFPKHALCAEPGSWQALVNHYHALSSIFNAL